jgi:hypothetical protein
LRFKRQTWAESEPLCLGLAFDPPALSLLNSPFPLGFRWCAGTREWTGGLSIRRPSSCFGFSKSLMLERIVKGKRRSATTSRSIPCNYAVYRCIHALWDREVDMLGLVGTVDLFQVSGPKQDSERSSPGGTRESSTSPASSSSSLANAPPPRPPPPNFHDSNSSGLYHAFFSAPEPYSRQILFITSTTSQSPKVLNAPTSS